MVAEHGSENQLNVENKDREKSQDEEAGAAVIELDARLLFHQFLPGKDSHDDGHAEKCLGQRSVSGGDRWREIEENREPSEDTLGDDGAERAPAEKAHPAA